jgi:hypothetical protein
MKREVIIIRKLLVVVVAASIFLFMQNTKLLYSEDECECDFDTPKYSAKCDCALICAVAIKDNRHCQIVCDGYPSNVDININQYFGDPSDYLSEMNTIRSQIFIKGFVAFNDRIFTQSALPRLLRSAYIGASFIDHKEKNELDKLITEIFYSFGEKITMHFSGNYPGTYEEELSKEVHIYTKLKMIKITFMQQYEIRLIFIK